MNQLELVAIEYIKISQKANPKNSLSGVFEIDLTKPDH
jgi:hypothetical protein